MNFEPFTGPGSTTARRALWAKVFAAVMSARKTEGKNASVTEYEGQGTLVAFKRDRGDCPCPRDITEIGGWHVNALAVGGDCVVGSILLSRTWLRINHDDEFTEPRQFKLWLDENCEIQYEDNRTTEPYIIEEDTAGVVSVRFVFTTLDFNDGPPPSVTIGFYIQAYLEAHPDDPPFCTATFADTEVELTKCDFSAMIDSFSTGTQLCDCDGTPNEGCTECWTAGGTLNFFGPV